MAPSSRVDGSTAPARRKRSLTISLSLAIRLQMRRFRGRGFVPGGVMRNQSFSKRIAAVTIVALGVAAGASADPVLVKSGFWTGDYGDGTGAVNLMGDGFTLRLIPLN